MRLIPLAIASAALASVASPAVAQEAAGSFTGPRIGVNVGTGGNNFIDFDGQTIGVDAGYDIDTGGAVVGVGVEYQTELGNDFFDLNESAVLARVGAKITPNALAYASGGYTRISGGSTPFGSNGDDGYRVGAGVEFGVGTGGTSLKVEQRYLDYGNGADAFQTVAGLSFRF
ncbi:MAG TPA: outer membrane beta-barrel protein [Tepidisphaeraceae bacterium]